jgi:hypothetical protein
MRVWVGGLYFLLLCDVPSVNFQEWPVFQRGQYLGLYQVEW